MSILIVLICTLLTVTKVLLPCKKHLPEREKTKKLVKNYFIAICYLILEKSNIKRSDKCNIKIILKRNEPILVFVLSSNFSIDSISKTEYFKKSENIHFVLKLNIILCYYKYLYYSQLRLSLCQLVYYFTE